MDQRFQPSTLFKTSPPYIIEVSDMLYRNPPWSERYFLDNFQDFVWIIIFADKSKCQMEIIP